MQGTLIELALPECASQTQKDAADWLCGVLWVLNGELLPKGSWKISGEDEGIALEYVIAPEEAWITKVDVCAEGASVLLRYRIGELVGPYVHDLKQRLGIAIAVYVRYPNVSRNSDSENALMLDDDIPRRRRSRRTKKRAPRQPRRSEKKEEE